MRFSYEETFLAEVLRDLAEARGTLPRWVSLVQAREDDGLDLADAQLDAGQAMGLVADLEAAIEDALEPLADVLEVPATDVELRDERATMPTLTVEGATLRLGLAPASIEELGTVTRRLALRLAEEPERVTVTVAEGLGGTGGCAAGDCLPEDAAPGPLFERRG